MNDTQLALWANEVQRLCLIEGKGDVEAALLAAEHIVSTQQPPANYKLSLQEGDPPEEETETALLYGEPEASSMVGRDFDGSNDEDDDKDGDEDSDDKKKKRLKHRRRRRRRAILRALHHLGRSLKTRPQNKGIPFATDITGREHRGRGPGGGQFVKKGTSDDEESEPTGGSRSRQRRRRNADDERVARYRRRVEEVSDESDDTEDDEERDDTTESDSDGPFATARKAAEAVEKAVKRTHKTVKRVDVTTKRIISTTKAVKRLAGYVNYFRNKGMEQMADIMSLFKKHVKEVGAEQVEEALNAKDADNYKKVQYQTTGAINEKSRDAKFLRKYLSEAGITLQTIGNYNPDLPLITSAPITEAQRKARSGDIVPISSALEDKLEESKFIPGLETTEDIERIAGEPVTHITDSVVSKLDAKYGKGKWIIKSYGDESYAGFGIFFPERVKAVKAAAKDTIWNAKRILKKKGYDIVRDNENNIIGVKSHYDSNVLRFGTEEPNSIQDRDVRIQIHKLSVAAQSENGAVLPRSPEDSLQQDYGIKLVKNSSGKVTGIIDEDMNEYGLNSRKYKSFFNDSNETIQHEIQRTIDHANDTADNSAAESIRYMAQPAFPALNVSKSRRAEGVTWEGSTEGRVHITVKDGKAVAVPYATLGNREDSLPVVVYTDDIRAMEKAAQEAVDALPEKYRTNRVFAPDVMKTKNGWKVVELNTSAETGSSLWLEENPFVIDAYVAHTTGRLPHHVNFVQRILRGEDKKARKWFSNEDQPRMPAGTPEGGQFAPKGKEHSGTTRTVKYGNMQVRYSSYKNITNRIKGPRLNLNNYKQADEHSCGFLAAFTVAKYYNLNKSSTDVLKATRTSVNYGVDRKTMRQGLSKLGLKGHHQLNLNITKLKKYVKRGIPVIVSLYKEDWYSDHWVIVQGFDEEKQRVHLTNYGSIPVKEFIRDWSYMDMEDNRKVHKGRKEGLIVLPEGASPSTYNHYESKALAHFIHFGTDAQGNEHDRLGRFTGKPTTQSEADRRAARERNKAIHLRNQHQQSKREESTKLLNSSLKSAEATKAQAEKIANEFFLHQSTKAKIKEPLKWARKKAQAQYDRLVEKYGVKGAIAIWGAGQVVTWGAQAGLVAANVPVPLPPGSGLAATAMLAAVVDIYRKATGKDKTTTNTEQ